MLPPLRRARTHTANAVQINSYGRRRLLQETPSFTVLIKERLQEEPHCESK